MKFQHTFALVFIIVIVLQIGCSQGYNVCDFMHAFAGETRSAFSLVPPSDTAGTGANPLVLEVRNLNPPLDPPLVVLNVTYYSQVGVNNAVSDADGIVILTDYISTQPMMVNVGKNTGDPVAFSFFSYVANFPLCFVQFTEGKDFFGKLPPKLQPSNTPARFYLSSPVPAGKNYFTVGISGAGSAYYSNNRNINEQSAQALFSGAGQVDWDVNTMGHVVFFLVIPDPASATPLPMVRATISWETHGVIPPPNPGGVPNPNPVAPGTPPGPSGISAEGIAEDAGIGFGSFLLFCILSGAIYIGGRSLYNYRVLGITQYPDFVPHHETFARIHEWINSLSRNVNHRRPGAPMSGLSRGGYEDVEREELEG